LMSMSIDVPALVPSDDQSSWPDEDVDAEKNSFPFYTIRFRGKLLDVPGLISFTKTVPASVPSVDQSSYPKSLFVPEKKTRLLKSVESLVSLTFVGSVTKVTGGGRKEVLAVGVGVKLEEGVIEGVDEGVGEFDGVVVGVGVVEDVVVCEGDCVAEAVTVSDAEIVVVGEGDCVADAVTVDDDEIVVVGEGVCVYEAVPVSDAEIVELRDVDGVALGVIDGVTDAAGTVSEGDTVGVTDMIAPRALASALDVFCIPRPRPTPSDTARIVVTTTAIPIAKV
jgi:hypothetical protein